MTAGAVFNWPIRVYYEDTDSGGVVYHTAYLRFMERARTEWLRALGFEQDALIERHGRIFAVRRIEIDYLRPARFNDALEVRSSIAECRRASLIFNQSIVNARDETLSRAKVQVASLDAGTLRPRPLPEYILAELRDVC